MVNLLLQLHSVFLRKIFFFNNLSQFLGFIHFLLFSDVFLSASKCELFTDKVNIMNLIKTLKLLITVSHTCKQNDENL